MPEWDADVQVGEAVVRELLAGQFPSLAARQVRLLAEGWDNSVWLVDEAIVFRFPRRALASPGIEWEIAVLPGLAPRLPLPIPAPAYVGRPSSTFPWPFFGARYLPGREIADAGLDDAARIRLGTALGRFLRVLHDPAVLAEHGESLPVDPMSRADMPARIARARERLEALEATGLWRPVERMERVFEQASGLGPAPGLALVHGDLHVRHVLVDGVGEAAAVIDWGDLCRADPAVDLAMYWSALPPEGRRAFRDAYGGIDADRLLRARVLALWLDAALAAYAHDAGMPPLLAETLRGLERTLVDD